MITFCNIKFVDSNGKELYDIVKHINDSFSLSFINSSSNLMKDIFYEKNIIPNTSGCIFRNVKDISLISNPEWLSMKMARDWMFYAEILRGGFLAYATKTINYFRRHNQRSCKN